MLNWASLRPTMLDTILEHAQMPGDLFQCRHLVMHLCLDAVASLLHPGVEQSSAALEPPGIRDMRSTDALSVASRAVRMRLSVPVEPKSARI